MSPQQCVRWLDLKTLAARKNRAVTPKRAASCRSEPIPTLLIRANKYRGFGLYVITASGPVPVFRNGGAVWFRSIEECAEELLDLDVDLDFENVLLDLGVWDCHLMPHRADAPRPARPQCARSARRGLRPLRPLGAQQGDRP